MQEAFLGEIELSDSGECSLSDFQTLPNISLINQLAQQYQGMVEIMPCQKQGEEVKLLISVYLNRQNLKGTIIANLIREVFPKDLSELKIMLEKAIIRLRTLKTLGNYEKSSIDLAEQNLQKIIANLPQI